MYSGERFCQLYMNIYPYWCTWCTFEEWTCNVYRSSPHVLRYVKLIECKRTGKVVYGWDLCTEKRLILCMYKGDVKRETTRWIFIATEDDISHEERWEWNDDIWMLVIWCAMRGKELILVNQFFKLSIFFCWLILESRFYNTFPSLDWISLTGLNIIDECCSSLPVLLAMASAINVSDMYKLYWNVKKEKRTFEICLFFLMHHSWFVYHSQSTEGCLTQSSDDNSPIPSSSYKFLNLENKYILLGGNF